MEAVNAKLVYLVIDQQSVLTCESQLSAFSIENMYFFFVVRIIDKMNVTFSETLFQCDTTVLSRILLV